MFWTMFEQIPLDSFYAFVNHLYRVISEIVKYAFPHFFWIDKQVVDPTLQQIYSPQYSITTKSYANLFQTQEEMASPKEGCFGSAVI